MDEMTLTEKLDFNTMCRVRIFNLEADIATVKIAMIPVCKECMNDGFECDSCQDFNGFVEEPCE